MAGGILADPDCVAGKHKNCTGHGWDLNTDSECPCDCPCHIPTIAALHPEDAADAIIRTLGKAS